MINEVLVYIDCLKAGCFFKSLKVGTRPNFFTLINRLSDIKLVSDVCKW